MRESLLATEQATGLRQTGRSRVVLNKDGIVRIQQVAPFAPTLPDYDRLPFSDDSRIMAPLGLDDDEPSRPG